MGYGEKGTKDVLRSQGVGVEVELAWKKKEGELGKKRAMDWVQTG